MKNNPFKSLLKLSWLFVAAFLVFTSCEEDDDDNGGPVVVVEDGIYIKGAGTALSELTFEGLMKSTTNEADGNNEREGLYELYVAVKGGADGFNIVVVEGTSQKTYGPGADFAEITGDDLHNEEPQEGFWRGTIQETSTKFTVPADGLYHVAYDQTLNTVVIGLVNWGVIGNATPGGWSGSTALTSSGFDLETITFSANLAMVPGEFKFRYSNGWKAFFDRPDNTVAVNTNFGGAVDALVAGGSNIVLEQSGMYDITLTWELGQPYAATMVRTGDVVIDYSDTPVGLIGEGVLVDGNPHNWDGVVFQHVPVVDGTKFVWTYSNVSFTANVGFKFREEAGWDGINLGFAQVTMAGPAAADFADASGNLSTTVGGAYDLVLDFDTTTESWTLTATKL